MLVHMNRFVLVLLVVCLAGPAAAQSRKALREGPQRGWTAQQMQRWLDYHAGQRFAPARSLDCADDFTNRRDAILNGNKITSQIFNFGSISAPGNRITDIVWNGLGYGFEFGPFVAAEIVDDYRQEGRARDPQSVPQRDAAGNVVRDARGDTVWVMHIVSDGLVSNGGEVSPDGTTFWGWHPIPCAQPVGSFGGLDVVNPASNKIPTNDAPDENLDAKPDSWPDAWFNPNLGRYVWPGALQQGVSNADKEALYFMNDYRNAEFSYWPFPEDSTKRGLGLEVEVRLYQWANPLAEDAIFLVYKITTKSPKDLDRVIFGMWGDPHIGGPNDWPDDFAFFDKSLNMVFAWDADGRSDIAGREPGYFGYKFLESPGVDDDGIDNDGDGYVDESWTDGIDNDGDWDPEFDDVGVDGIAGTGDEGEGDGLPTAGSLFDITRPGEPDFEFTDIDESDQIGLTSFASPPFAGNRVSNDERLWSLVEPGRFDEVSSDPGDYVFLYGSGDFRLRAGETKRFSIALILGENLQDLKQNARTVQQIFEVGYRFAKPPDKPHLRAVPGDGRVTLYWDDRAETSIDPLTRDQDFEGYVIYRSTDPSFSDQQTITDVNGTRFLYKPLTNALGVEAKFDLKNGITGPSPIPYQGRGLAYDLGDDTGLFHTYVDSTGVINGQTYYYSVVAYDRGMTGDASELGADFANGIPPSETSKTITFDPTTDTFVFDVNTAVAVPRPRVAGYVPPGLVDERGVVREEGLGTGQFRIDIVDPLAVPDAVRYRVAFETVGGELVYSVIKDGLQTVTFENSASKVNRLGFPNILPETFTLQTGDGRTLTPDVDYLLNPESGSVQVLADVAGELTATFSYAPLLHSRWLHGEEANIVFDGMHLFVEDDPLAVDPDETGWAVGGGGIAYAVRVATSGPGRVPQPADYEIRFADGPVGTSVSNDVPVPFEVVNLSQANAPVQVFTPDINRNNAWDVDEPIILVETLGGALTATWEVNFLDAEVRPEGGSVFVITTRKPFAAGDVFSFRTRAAGVDPGLVREELDDIYVVPNPYVVTTPFEPRNPVERTQRGERRLYFANVPRQCTIRIYTLAGELVDVIHHDSTLDDGKAFWDLKTKESMNLAYGLYLFHVESPEGTYVGKFAVIK